MNPITSNADEATRPGANNGILNMLLYGLGRFDDRLDVSIRTLYDFDNCLTTIIDNLGLHIASATLLNFDFNIKNTDDEPDYSDRVRQGNVVAGGTLNNRNQAETRHGNTVLEVADKIAKLGEGAVKVREAFGELPPVMTSFKKAFSIVGELNKGAKGITALLSETGTSTELVSQASKMLSGLGGMAEAGTAFGPPGGILSAAILSGGAIVTIADEKQKKEKGKAAEKERKTRKYLETFVMPEQEAEKYMDHIHLLANQREHIWQLANNPVSENINEYGQQAYDLTWPIPVSKQDGTVHAYNLPPGVPKPGIEIPSKKISYQEQIFELKQRLKYSAYTRGITKFDAKAVEALKYAERYGKLLRSHNVAVTNSAIKESAYSISENANRGKVVSDDIRHIAVDRNTTDRSGSVSTGRRIININLNKPMIENFTISTNNTNEGVLDFKHKVEEVLLEILNSANAIK